MTQTNLTSNQAEINAVRDRIEEGKTELLILEEKMNELHDTMVADDQQLAELTNQEVTELYNGDMKEIKEGILRIQGMCESNELLIMEILKVINKEKS